MNKLLIVLCAALISTSAFAGCLKNAQERVADNKDYLLVNDQSIFLSAGEETMAYKSEVYNNYAVEVEVFFTQKKNSYYTSYGALLFNKNTCKFLHYQPLGDNL